MENVVVDCLGSPPNLPIVIWDSFTSNVFAKNDRPEGIGGKADKSLSVCSSLPFPVPLRETHSGPDLLLLFIALVLLSSMNIPDWSLSYCKV